VSENPAQEKLHNPGTVSSVLAARGIRIVTRCIAEETESQAKYPACFRSASGEPFARVALPVDEC
jgi:hypothetical protein